MNRRHFLKTAVASLASTSLPRFAMAKTGGGAFQLEAVKGKGRLYGNEGGLSDLWLYNGQLPGPEIRVKRGEWVKVRFKNSLEEPTSVHWHGIRIDNAMDGVSGLTQSAVQPGETFDYEFVVPDAGTYWYHAHHMSWNQVPRGLAGPLIVEEDEPTFEPDTDITLALSDWRLDDNGVLDTASFGAMHDFSHAGRLGNWLTINGQNMPDIPVQKGRWHRLRLINMSASRILDLAPSRFGAQLIGLDGQIFDSPREVDGTIQLAPAQRMDLVMRPDGDGPVPFETMTGQPYTFANFTISNEPKNDDPLRLPNANALPEPDLNKARSLPLVMAGGAMGRMQSATKNGQELSMRELAQAGDFWAFNGQAGMGEKPFFSAKRGETIILESTNDTAFPHAIHLHGHHFRVLERNGEKLQHPDWRDTFTTQRGETVKIAFVADNPGKWLLHCHMLGHAASGMMDWFEVN
ncbi:multicopper oxidase family protein [Roseibium sp.]|uniref:multicopper oxidase family protein n=1 Tax=Roseibium sp. TaxID=1936156 RepID=UPI003B520EC9